MIIVWKRSGHLALTLPAAVALLQTAAVHAPSKSSQTIAIMIAAAVVVVLGHFWNRSPDVEDQGPHLFFGLPMELWGLAVVGLGVLDLLSQRALMRSP
jgi:hypothetical protein